MLFLSAGDFIFPFTFSIYWAKQVFLWSFQNGAVNLDGIIRIFSKSPLLLPYMVSGNVAASYAYIFLTLVICFIGLYSFLGYFFRSYSKLLKVAVALFFAVNPIFLGNFAKAGLTIAVAMLPLMLVLTDLLVRRRQTWAIVPLAITINISFIHPFTLAINLCIAFMYALIIVCSRATSFKDFVKAGSLLSLVTILLHAYVILPVAAIGSLSKTTLLQSFEEPPDFTNLIYIANTGNILTSLTLSKDVLKDFNFFADGLAGYYVASLILLYVIIGWVYCLKYKQLSLRQKQLIAVSAAVFLGLSLLATGTFLNVDKAIKFIIELPGGWSFRSPLKWQLYQPFFLCIIIVVLAAKVVSTKANYLLGGIGVVIFVGMNGYIAQDVYAKLLAPRHVHYFQSLVNIDMEHKRLLQISNKDCPSLYKKNPDANIEFNQIISSKNVQVTSINSDQRDFINLSDYDFLISCSPEELAGYRLLHNYPDFNMSIFAATNQQPFVRATTALFASNNLLDQSGKKALVESVLHQKYNFVTDKDSQYQVISLFSGLSRQNLDLINNQIVYPLTIPPAHFRNLHTYTKNDAGQFNEVAVADAKLLHITNQDNLTQYSYSTSHPIKNSIPEASFENKLWNDKVQDCYNYDNRPDISMTQSDESIDGQYALQLSARRHTACSFTSVPVTPSARYLFNISFKTNDTGDKAGYTIKFNNSDEVFEDKVAASREWQEINQTIDVPQDASTATIYLYGYQGDEGKVATILYDRAGLFEIPKIAETYYAAVLPVNNSSLPKVAYQIDNPTKFETQITQAKAPFYLIAKDMYNSEWKLRLRRPGSNVLPIGYQFIDDRHHLMANGAINGWYVDPAELCKDDNPACSRNADGSYNLELVAEFFPQRWFYLGLLISGTTLFACISYLGFAGVRGMRRRNGRFAGETSQVARQQDGEAASNRNSTSMLFRGDYPRKNATLARLVQFSRDRWSIKSVLNKIKEDG